MPLYRAPTAGGPGGDVPETLQTVKVLTEDTVIAANYATYVPGYLSLDTFTMELGSEAVLEVG